MASACPWPLAHWHAVVVRTYCTHATLYKNGPVRRNLACLPACHRLPYQQKSYISESKSESEGSNLQITKIPRREQRERKKSLAMPATSIICKCLRLYCIIISVLGIKPPRGFRVPAPKLQLFSSYYPPPPPPSLEVLINIQSTPLEGGYSYYSTAQHSIAQYSR